jgi:hypothetical protein
MLQLGTIFYYFLTTFIIGVFFIMCFSSFYLVYASTSYVFLFVIRFRVYVKILGLRFLFILFGFRFRVFV